MATNTVKALTEERAKKATEVRSVHDELSKETDAAKRGELQTRFDALYAEVEDISERLARAERVESMEGFNGGTGYERTGQDIVDDLGSNGTEERDSPILNPDAAGYSLLRALRMRADGRELNGVEGEIHQELAKRYSAAGRAPAGLLVPHTLRMDGGRPDAEKRMDTTDGTGLIPDIQANTLIDVLRKRVVMRRMGSVVLSNMVGTFALPKKTAANTFEWVAEGGEATGSDMTVGNVTFSEKTLTGWTLLTRSLLKQSSFDAEALARMDLVEGLAIGLDYAGLANASGGNGPTGLLYMAGIDTVDIGTNGGAPTWAKVVEMETKVFSNDADVDSMGYVFNAPTRGKLKTTEKATNTGRFIWEDGNVNGYQSATSNQLPSNLTKGSGTALSAAVFGNFRDAVFALWGGLDILINPFSNAKSGSVLLTVHQSADFNVRRTESFSRCLDIATV